MLTKRFLRQGRADGKAERRVHHRDLLAASANCNAFGASGVQAVCQRRHLQQPDCVPLRPKRGFANGVMCESRPGAVLPLRSGADGALGLDRLGSAPRTPLTSRAECMPKMSSDAARNLGGQIAAGTRQALRRICCAPASFPQLTAFDSCSTMKAMFNGAVRSVRAE